MVLNGSSDNILTSSDYQASEADTQSPYWLPSDIRLFRIISCIVPPLGLIFNIVVFITLSRVRNLLPTNAARLMSHQSFIDGLNSVFFGIIQVPLQPSFPEGAFGYLVCVIYQKMVFATDAVGQWNNFIISIERFYAICYPLRRQIFTTKVVFSLIAFNWLFCALLCYGMGFLYVKLEPNGYCIEDPNSVQYTPYYGFLYALFFYCIPMLTMPVCYTKMVSVIHSSAKMLQSSAEHKATAATSRLIKTLIAASIFLVITNVPDIVLFMFMFCIFGYSTMAYYSWTYTFTVLAKSIGPVVNPIIYSFAIPKFRYAVKDAFSIC